MKLPVLRTRLGVAALMTALAFGGCTKNDDGNGNIPPQGNATVTMRLTDGPADYDAVWLDIRQVEVITDADARIVLTPARPGLYDILRLRNGIDTLLLTAPMPAGTISQIRLILGDNNSVVVNGQPYALTTPSAQQSGLKLNIHETLLPGQAYTIWLDFDAGKSIHQTGSGKYMLKPVIRAYTAQTNGRITGYVLPEAALATVYAVEGADTFSAIPGPAGYFQFNGLPAATYQVYIEPGVAGFASVSIPNVQVAYGVVSDLGTITLRP
jgi:hypothetical protein